MKFFKHHEIVCFLKCAPPHLRRVKFESRKFCSLLELDLDGYYVTIISLHQRRGYRSEAGTRLACISLSVQKRYHEHQAPLMRSTDNNVLNSGTFINLTGDKSMYLHEPLGYATPSPPPPRLIRHDVRERSTRFRQTVTTWQASFVAREKWAVLNIYDSTFGAFQGLSIFFRRRFGDYWEQKVRRRRETVSHSRRLPTIRFCCC
jgi:hypothetical protein